MKKTNQNGLATVTPSVSTSANIAHAFIHSDAFRLLIKVRAALSFAFMVGGLIFLTIGAYNVLLNMRAPQTLTVTGKSGGLWAVGDGTVLMVCSLVPFLLAYLARPSIRFRPQSRRSTHSYDSKSGITGFVRKISERIGTLEFATIRIL